MTELHALTARAAARAVAVGRVTVEDLVRSHLERIAEVEPTIGAWQHLDEAQAIASARRLDACPDAPLRGVIVGVKDVIATADMPTGYGSRIYQGFRPPFDASCVAQARNKGALILGKTVSTEFAGPAPSKTQNPFNDRHTPGGSSSGSAAAVAAKMAQLALGTQTAGSTIRPAAYCGVVGFKPTYGYFDLTGVKPLASVLDTLGFFARDVRDVGFFAAALSDNPSLSVSDISPPTIAVFRSEAWPLARPEARMALERATERLGLRGARIIQAPRLPVYEDLISLHDAVFAWGVLEALSFERLNCREAMAPATLDLIARFEGLSDRARFGAAMATAKAARAGLEALFGEADALITLSATGEAPLGLGATGDPSFNRPWTLLHTPCVNVPTGRGPNELPLGVQIVGRIGDDARTLSIAAFLEAALDDE